MLHYYIQPKSKMRPSKKTVRFETQPGYQLQYDWGKVEVEVTGQRCKVNFAVNTLGSSVASMSSPHQSRMLNTPMNRWFAPSATSVAV